MAPDDAFSLVLCSCGARRVGVGEPGADELHTLPGERSDLGVGEPVAGSERHANPRSPFLSDKIEGRGSNTLSVKQCGARTVFRVAALPEKDCGRNHGVKKRH